MRGWLRKQEIHASGRATRRRPTNTNTVSQIKLAQTSDSLTGNLTSKGNRVSMKKSKGHGRGKTKPGGTSKKAGGAKPSPVDLTAGLELMLRDASPLKHFLLSPAACPPEKAEEEGPRATSTSRQGDSRAAAQVFARGRRGFGPRPGNSCVGFHTRHLSAGAAAVPRAPSGAGAADPRHSVHFLPRE